MKKFFAFTGTLALFIGLIPAPVLASHDSCSFTINTYNGGTSVMHSYLTASLDDSSPSGTITSGRRELLRVDFTARGLGCSDVKLDGYLFSVEASDRANSGWVRNMQKAGAYGVDVSTGQTVTTNQKTWVKSTSNGLLAGFKMSGFSIEAGETMTIAFYADVSSASTSLDDSVRAAIGEDSLAWHDSFSHIHRMDHSVINGNTLTF